MVWESLIDPTLENLRTRYGAYTDCDIEHSLASRDRLIDTLGDAIVISPQAAPDGNRKASTPRVCARGCNQRGSEPGG